jgi:nitrogen fixation protein FixH
MAYFARTSWSGLVVENTYVASQQFNAKAALARRIAESGVKGALDVKGEAIAYQLTDSKAAPVIADAVTLRFRRPVGDRQDFTLELADAGHGLFRGSHVVIPGQWIVEAEAHRGGEVVMHEAVRIMVTGAE